MMDQTMNWVFDTPHEFITMRACTATRYDPITYNNNNGRWNISNIHWYWRNAMQWYSKDDVRWMIHGLDDRPSRYAYPVGAFAAPHWWSGWPGNEHGHVSLFELIPSVVRDDARARRALIIIDNLNEGFHEPQLWRFFHDECQRLGIPPQVVVFMNGNTNETKAYQAWCDENGTVDRLHMIPFCHLMYQQQTALLNYGTVSWEDHIRHKSDPANRIKLFNCLNRVPREHREKLFLKMLQADLIRSGSVSHWTLQWHWQDEDIDPWTVMRANTMLPLVVDDPDFDNNKAMHGNPRIYLDTWLSVITETHANDDPHQMFISEKPWKPIYYRQPFIVLGNRGTLSELHRMGYSCDFAGWSTWDELPYEQRVDAIVNTLLELRKETDMMAWLETCRERCEHNRDLFMRKDFFESEECDALLKIYHRILIAPSIGG